MIIDCFTFFDELDLLDVRLNELCDTVDFFVLTESIKTFSGLNKPLYFEENKKRYKDFNIVHTIYNDAIKCHPMERERRQKQYNLDYVFNNIFKAGDIIIQGDCDEIPKAVVVKEAAKDEQWKSVGLAMSVFYYYMNCIQKNRKETKRDSRLLRPTDRIKYDVSQKDKVDKIIRDAGWHFSYIGDIQAKLKSWGHAIEYNKPPFNTKEHIKMCKEQGLDLIMRKGRRRLDFEFVEDLNYLPEYVLKNKEKFNKYIKGNQWN